MCNRGSEWRRWDLHIHTKGTNKADNYACHDINDYCELLFKKAFEKKVYAIGITDYFSIERYIEVKEYPMPDKEHLFTLLWDIPDNSSLYRNASQP